MTVTLSARDLFQTAYENRYTWDEAFPGFQADVVVHQGEVAHRGHVCIGADLKFEISNVDDDETRQLLERQVQDVMTHRRRQSFAQAHSRNEFFLGDVGADGSIAIQVRGDAMGSHYRVTGPVITQVSRTMGGMTFTIDTLGWEQTAQGYLPTHYRAVFRQADTGELVREVDFQDSYTPAGRYYLLERQVLTVASGDQVTSTTLEFQNLHLLA